ncbi:MAG TPA: glycoside hydrolase family 15 protein [Tepidisphaeraceae bacterium]|nr:glycoside hydrolase family 15 protein [Tepidisphaeraceae bacterium]
MSQRIEDYALIGDCQTAALVGKDGSIDWLCVPRFDSGACFAALLGTPEHGRWLITPVGAARSIRRRYRDSTLILETEYDTDEGTVTLIDFMPPRNGPPELVRLVEGKRGTMRMRTELTIRFDYGSIVPWVRRLEGDHGLRAIAGPDTLYCRTKVPLKGQNMHTAGDFTVAADQRIAFTLTWNPTYAPAPAHTNPETALRDTEKWWRKWSQRCTYDGRWQEQVLRSLITLKALTYEPTGGIVAAATSSLPESLGGKRNWDYRFCWLRDATFTLYAMNVGGYHDEAKAWRKWLVNAVAGTPADLQIMYGLAGERRLTELELPWLPGYDNSHPVRVGNDAYQQKQLDVYGELMDSLYTARQLGLGRDDEAWRIEEGIADYLATAWREPDKGIWEIRGDKRPFTYSKVMAWAAFDRAVKSVEQFGEKGDADKWRRARDEVYREVMDAGFNHDVNAFTQYYGSKEPDASLLLLPMVGFIDARDPRMLGTVDLIKRKLMRDGFVERYSTSSGVDGLPGSESVFLICTFWLADNLAMQGKKSEAEELFERVLAISNDVGLLSEEYDPARRRMVGNFPQAFSHVGLVNCARNLSSPGGPAEHRGGSSDAKPRRDGHHR